MISIGTIKVFDMSLDFATAIRQAHNTIHQNLVPTDGSVCLYQPTMMAERNIHREREFLVDQPPIAVVREGPAYIWTLATGQKYVSFQDPATIQWERKN